jgi:hypothetical protein
VAIFARITRPRPSDAASIGGFGSVQAVGVTGLITTDLA